MTTQVVDCPVEIEVRPAKPSDILEAAAHELKVRPWIRGDMVNSEGGVCALGALLVVECGEGAVRAWVADGYPGNNLGADTEAHSYLSRAIQSTTQPESTPGLYRSPYLMQMDTLRSPRSWIVRYNDNVCPNAQQMERLFHVAAAMARAEGQ